MKDAARFALAIAAILSATALDGQQGDPGEYQNDSGTLAARSEAAVDPAAPRYARLEDPEPDEDGFGSGGR